jgi:hypothetical protein
MEYWADKNKWQVCEGMPENGLIKFAASLHNKTKQGDCDKR